MNRNIIKTMAMVLPLALFMIYGCKKDFLKTTNPNKNTEEQFWKTEADLKSAVASVYSLLRQPLYGYWGAFTGIQNINSLGDDVLTFPGGEAATTNIALFTNEATNSDASSTFSALYKSIYRANLVLANAEKVKVSDDVRNAYIAEAKFLRGLCYFTLASNFGDVPLIITSAKTADDQFVPSKPVAEVYAQAISDFTDAKNGLLPTRPTADLGRATSGAAIAYLGKTYLYIKDYPKAEATLALLNTAPYTYDLIADYSENFTSKNEFNKEAVFQWVYGPFGDPYGPWGVEGANSPMYNYLPQLIGPPGGGGWFKYVPTNYLIDQFKSEQRPVGSDTKFDKRMYYSLSWKRSNFGEADITWYGGTKTFDDLWASAQANISKIDPKSLLDVSGTNQFLINKFTNGWSGVASADNYWSATPSTANNVIMRYAEVLLMHAEAAAKNGNLAAAIADLKRIRARAGLVEKTAVNLPDLTSVMNEISHQKLLEMFFEQNRWHDLKRWYTPAELKAHFTQTNKHGAPFLQPKHYIFPIPTGELQTNNKIEQNILWR
ncbi:RagB/SusD family nutrient uptake outer membrane protein [Pedobacter nyackensis]|uniref:Starch-binding associating with outer membrane n=1 Tax=Pedobacter nyackensis TaxID=475255 RepID=A0A1W2F185_9SPHI|nr:RagB/SusD family nutrient uptake outer membrane protein [Pedobacter nyackensis]SMD15226.1 Starch-binding associating with outer membrane [Pedobacter nyackensis]